MLTALKHLAAKTHWGAADDPCFIKLGARWRRVDW